MTKPHCSSMCANCVRATAIAMLAFWTLACQEQTPTSVDNGLVPKSPITVEIELPFDSFARGVAVFGGFGRNNLTILGAITGHAANEFGDDQIDVRTLSRFGALPVAAVVQDTTGATVTDRDLTFLGGSVRVLVDTLASTLPDSIQLSLAATTEAWDAGSASWSFAVDSAGHQQPWTVAGGGATMPIATTVWDHETQLDTIYFQLDSATVAQLTDTTVDARGVLLRSLTPASNVAILGVSMGVVARPASNPDTTVSLAVALAGQTFMYDPPPTPDSTKLWVGGAPAWRSVFTVDVPRELNGPESLCALVPCPVTITPELITSALMTLRTASVSSSFLPADSVLFDARVVLDPERLPNAPIGGTLGFLPVMLPPNYFTTQVGTDVNVPITTFVQLLLEGPDEAGNEPPNTLALVATLEPSALGFAAFEGAGQEGAPRIRLVLTIPEGLR